jgi:TATA-binding protein-associated factor
MSSRLERLFTLIEHGENVYLRKTAAFQIGEIVKTHPGELNALVQKVCDSFKLTGSDWS